MPTGVSGRGVSLGTAKHGGQGLRHDGSGGVGVCHRCGGSRQACHGGRGAQTPHGFDAHCFLEAIAHEQVHARQQLSNSGSSSARATSADDI